jgi:hypothetical protein
MDSQENVDDTTVPTVENNETLLEKHKESSILPVAESPGPVVSDMVDADLVKTTEQFKFNFKIGKKTKSMSEAERKKICNMVEGLAKYNDLGGLPDPHRRSSLSLLIDSELATLHSSDGNKGDSHDNNTDKKPNKTGVHVASVSAEKQLQFETMLKEDLTSVTHDVEDLHISTGARPKIKSEPEDNVKQVQKAGNQQNQTEESNKGTSKKKGENKKSPKKKGTL